MNTDRLMLLSNVLAAAGAAGLVAVAGALLGLWPAAGVLSVFLLLASWAARSAAGDPATDSVPTATVRKDAA